MMIKKLINKDNQSLYPKFRLCRHIHRLSQIGKLRVFVNKQKHAAYNIQDAEHIYNYITRLDSILIDFQAVVATINFYQSTQ